MKRRDAFATLAKRSTTIHAHDIKVKTPAIDDIAAPFVDSDDAAIKCSDLRWGSTA